MTGAKDHQTMDNQPPSSQCNHMARVGKGSETSRVVKTNSA